MGKYLGYVIVHNLLPGDYSDQKLEEIKNAINFAISTVANGKVIENNIGFSFPQDPSVASATIPIIIDVKLLFMIVKEDRINMAEGVREAFLSLSGETRKNAIIAIWDSRLQGTTLTINS